MRSRVAALLAASLIAASLGAAGPVMAAERGAVVLDWNQHAVEALFNGPTAALPGAGRGPTVGAIDLAMVQIAVYDAVNAIDDGATPYLARLPDAPSGASQSAAAAAAAHRVLLGVEPALPAGVVDRLNTLLATTLDGIPAGAARNAGVAIGEAAASAILADRVGDGRGGSFRFRVGTLPGEWRPTSGVNDPFAWVKDVRPFALRHGAQYISEGVLSLDSRQYAVEFDEVKAYGAATNSSRSPEQTATALYFTENPFTLYNRSFRELSDADHKALSAAGAARLLAMTNVAGADALIACWNNKAHWSNWRPITAIHLAAEDGNEATVADPTWSSLVVTPPYPDNTSGYNCATGGYMYAARAFFRTDKVAFDLINAGLTRRSYGRLSDVLDDTIDARVWLGLHFRFADVQGAWVGKKAGQWVGSRFFEPVR